MGHLPVIPNVYRVTLLWVGNLGVKPRNVIHVHDDTGTSNESAVGTRIGAIFGSTSNLFQCVDNAQLLPFLQVLKLDGFSAGVTVGFSTTSGGGAGQMVPSTAGLLKLQTGFRGPAHRGRLYLGPCTEDQIVNGKILPSTVTSMNTAWGTAFTALGSGAPALSLGVASYKLGTFSTCPSAPFMEELVGTQRRRQQQLRK